MNFLLCRSFSVFVPFCFRFWWFQIMNWWLRNMKHRSFFSKITPFFLKTLDNLIIDVFTFSKFCVDVIKLITDIVTVLHRVLCKNRSFLFFMLSNAGIYLTHCRKKNHYACHCARYYLIILISGVANHPFIGSFNILHLERHEAYDLHCRYRNEKEKKISHADVA